MSKETPKDDPRQQSDHASHKQTDKPWKGNPEKEQRNDDAKIDLEKWHETKTHWSGRRGGSCSRLRWKVSDAGATPGFRLQWAMPGGPRHSGTSDLNTRGTTSRPCQIEQGEIVSASFDLEFDPQLVWVEDPALRKRRCGGDHEEEK
jgi:hypothetical protein